MIFLDTSAIYALADAGDRWHAPAVSTLNRLRAAKEKFLTHSWIVYESAALLDARLGRPALKTFLDHVTAHEIEWIGPDLHAAAVRELASAPAGVSLVDAASFAVMRRRAISTAFTFDPHFRNAGFRVEGAAARG